jgi:CheY-like chemotaxis protein
LIVDDEIDIRSILRNMFETNGLKVYEADDGIDGLEMCQKHKFDLVISDIQMPKMDGLTMLTQLRADSTFHSKFIIITGALQNNLTGQINSIIDSADGLLRKPFRNEELLQIAGLYK